ncbi:MAG: 8-oxo-dGTP diphosphatase [Parcubacteria group bacterium]|nr:8-oxo-dGTP diphosphatase [Parcubacteria group bacterium]
MMKILTLCIVHQGSRVLLGMKKRGFGVGRWNGFGGKVQEGETIDEAAKRELKEEAGVEVGGIEKLGVINFEFQGNSELLEVHVFRGRDIFGEVRESDEMRPQWFGVNEIPFDAMWPDDRHWIPLFLQGKKFQARFLFADLDSILDMRIETVKEL